MVAMLACGLLLAGLGGGASAQGSSVEVRPVPQVLIENAQQQHARPDATRFARSLVEEADGQAASLDLVFEPATGLTTSVGVAGQSMSVSAQVATVTGGATSETQRIYEVTLHPGVGYTEKFLVAPASNGAQRPMLVVFHRFGVSHFDVLYNTDFFAEGMKRGWHVVAPLGASGVHFSSIESQTNTEAVLNWMVSNFQIDKTRVYGVGFSMGGGAALNYAARHLDPSGVMFAAVLNHTGTVCLEDAYLNEPTTQSVFDFWFGDGTPGSYDPFKMKRSSLIYFNPVTLQVEANTDLARNLMHMSSRTLRASSDPLAYLMVQNDVLHAHLQSLGAAFGQHALYIYPSNTHSWNLLDEKVACDWLRPQRLQMPTAASTLADRDGRYFDFTVRQETSGAFTPFHWAVDVAANKLTLSHTANLDRLDVHTNATGFSPLANFTAVLSTADGLPDELRFLNWNHLPFNVLRDGVATTSWNYSSSSGNLFLTEFDGTGTHTWVVVP